MFENIRWQAFIRTPRAEKVDRLMRRFSTAAGCPMVIQRCERYWKDRGLFEVWFTSPLCEETVEKAVFRTLLICHSLKLRWTVTGPYSGGEGIWMFRGEGMNHAQGIELVFFEVDNWPADSQDGTEAAAASEPRAQ